MTPEQLKASILQYAIQGKLVEQRAEEGTAEELYQKIQEEKQKLIKEGKIKKEKPLGDITEDEIPFEIPSMWKWVKWGDVVNVVSARRVHQSDWRNEGIPFYRAREIAELSRNNGKIDNDLYISEELYKELSLSGVPKPGDIMVTAVGTLGKTYVVKEDDKFYYKDASVICFENHYKMCSEYLAMMMDTQLMRQQIKSNSDGTTVATLTMVRMNEYLLPLPPLREQYRIIAKIEELLPLVERYAEAYEKLEKFNAKFPEDMKKSILQYAIMGKLVEQREEEGTAEELYKLIEDNRPLLNNSKNELIYDAMEFEIPNNWKWVEINQIYKFVDYRGKTPNKTSEGVFLVTASNIRVGYMDYIRKEYISIEEYETRKSRGITRKGDLLFTTEAPMGNAAICDLDECSCGQRVITFQEYCKDTLNNKLFMYFINSSVFQKQLIDNCTGTTAKGIKADKLKHLRIPLPPIGEQYRIVAKIEELLPYCERFM